MEKHFQLQKNISFLNTVSLSILGFILLLIVSSCNNDKEYNTRITNSAYPPPENEVIITVNPYPDPDQQNDSNTISPNPYGNVLFDLGPVVGGDTSVSGLGPFGIHLQVVDITMVEIIGSGSIGEDNQFIIQLSKPLVKGHLIGIQLGIQRENETWLHMWNLRGEGARSIPNIGYFFDSEISQ